jgi:hypothetical protein
MVNLLPWTQDQTFGLELHDFIALSL